MTTADLALAPQLLARWLRIVPLLAAVLILNFLLILPNHPDALTLWALTMLALELPILLLLLLLAPPRWSRWLALAGSILLALVSLLKALDMAAYLSFARPFDLVLDSHLVVAAWYLLSGSLGMPLTVIVVAVFALAVSGIGWLGYRTARRVAASRLNGGEYPVALALALGLLVSFAVADAGKQLALWPSRTAAFSSRIYWQHGLRIHQSMKSLRSFQAAVQNDQLTDLQPPTLLQGLTGHDVLLMFVESYGRSSLDHPRYAATTRAALEELQRAVDIGGLAVRSGWLDSPIQGGQSWMAHATLLSGLWIDSQPRYRAFLASRRQTLIHAFERAGWESVSMMPAITMFWPEGESLGFDRIYDAAALEYRGLPFNWVTMPDQYTLAELYRRELSPVRRSPLFVKVALISSHAPWTPIPPVLDWEEIGDGRIFEHYARLGDPPAVVWRDYDRVRDQFRRSIDYVLRTLASFTEARLGSERLMIVVGDHQPAPLITGQGAVLHVPVHIVGPGALLAQLDDWGWTPATAPADDAPVWSMAAFRDRFLDAFSGDRRVAGRWASIQHPPGTPGYQRAQGLPSMGVRSNQITSTRNDRDTIVTPMAALSVLQGKGTKGTRAMISDRVNTTVPALRRRLGGRGWRSRGQTNPAPTNR